MDNTKLCSTLPIVNTPKNEILNDYSKESCLVIDDNNDESNNENRDQKMKVAENQCLAPVTIMVVDTISTVNQGNYWKSCLIQALQQH